MSEERVTADGPNPDCIAYVGGCDKIRALELERDALKFDLVKIAASALVTKKDGWDEAVAYYKLHDLRAEVERLRKAGRELLTATKALRKKCLTTMDADLNKLLDDVDGAVISAGQAFRGEGKK